MKRGKAVWCDRAMERGRGSGDDGFLSDMARLEWMWVTSVPVSSGRIRAGTKFEAEELVSLETGRRDGSMQSQAMMQMYRHKEKYCLGCFLKLARRKNGTTNMRW